MIPSEKLGVHQYYAELDFSKNRESMITKRKLASFFQI